MLGIGARLYLDQVAALILISGSDRLLHLRRLCREVDEGLGSSPGVSCYAVEGVGGQGDDVLARER